MNSMFSDKVEMLRSNKGGAKIIFKGYMYTIHKKVQGRIRWRCSQRTLHCKGSITTGNGAPLINLPHNHVPDMHAIARARCRGVPSPNCSVDVIPLQNPEELLRVEHSGSVPLSKEMENWQIRRTPRGIRLIDGKGYTYTKDRHVGNKSYWRCDYRQWKCKARASLSGASTTLGVEDQSKGHLMFNLMSHGHQPTLKRKPPKSDNDNENEFEEDVSDSPNNKSLLKPSPNQGTAKPKHISASQVSAPKPPPSPESEMCLRWNSHHANMSTVIPALMDDERYVDVTLVAEGSLLKCHKLILSSCSPYFDDMLKSTNSTQQTIIFLRDIQFWQMKALVDFMYKGEVNIDQSKLESLLQAAEDLQIKGLAGKAPKKQEMETTNDSLLLTEASETDVKSEKNSASDNNYPMDDDDEEYFPHNEYRRVRYKKNRKRKISTPPDPSLLKHVKINLKGTKSRPNIKQPKFYSPDYPEYDPDRCVSPPKLETDPVFHIDNIKLEPIDIELPQSPTFFEMNSMMDKSISETQEKEKKSEGHLNKPKETKFSHEGNRNSYNKITEIQPSTSKEIMMEKPPPDPLDISKMEKFKFIRESGQSLPGKDILNINKKAIIVKCQNVKKLIDENSSIQKILDSATTKQTLSESDKSKLPKIRVRNLPTTETMLKKFATTQLTSILKKGDTSPTGQHIILKKLGTKPTILRHTLPTKKTKELTEIKDIEDIEINEKILLLAKTKKEKEETKDENDSEVTEKKDKDDDYDSIIPV